MLQNECNHQEGYQEEYDKIDMNFLKEMLGLKNNDETDHRNHDKSKKDIKPDNVLLNTSKVYDFDEPSSKVSNIFPIAFCPWNLVMLFQSKCSSKLFSAIEQSRL